MLANGPTCLQFQTGDTTGRFDQFQGSHEASDRPGAKFFWVADASFGCINNPLGDDLIDRIGSDWRVLGCVRPCKQSSVVRFPQGYTRPFVSSDRSPQPSALLRHKTGIRPNVLACSIGRFVPPRLGEPSWKVTRNERRWTRPRLNTPVEVATAIARATKPCGQVALASGSDAIVAYFTSSNAFRSVFTLAVPSWNSDDRRALPGAQRRITSDAQAWGTGGREFKSRRSDQILTRAETGHFRTCPPRFPLVNGVFAKTAS